MQPEYARNGQIARQLRLGAELALAVLEEIAAFVARDDVEVSRLEAETALKQLAHHAQGDEA